MDRHVEFATQLSLLVALYARDTVDHAAEKAALRAARGAAKHGAVDITLEDGRLRAGREDAGLDQPDVAALQALLTTLGVRRIRAPHHARQDEMKRLARLLGAVAAARKSAQVFASELAAHQWNELNVECIPAVPPPAEPVLEASEDGAAAAAATAQPAADVAATPAMTPETDAEAEEAEEAVPTKPLAEKVPAVVDQLLGTGHRELFERLITASTPLTLRRLLEPVQVTIEQSIREGAIPVAVRLLLAMFACEACADDDEMRRQFVVTLRRLTKPTLTRAFAMHYADAPDGGAEVEQVLARFGEDGAEAVADRIGNAPTRDLRVRYTELLARLPGANDALLAMLDDERESVVERAIGLIVALPHPEVERVLGEQLNAEHARVRLAAVRGLATATGSAFAADALLRAVQDAAPEVRLAAAVGLQARREQRLASVIVRRIDEEAELDVQLALVATLGRVIAPEGVQKLVALANPTERILRRPNMPLIRLSAIEAMGEARTPAAMVALQKLLEDRDSEVRETAARLYTRARRQTTATPGLPAVSDS